MVSGIAIYCLHIVKWFQILPFIVCTLSNTLPNRYIILIKQWFFFFFFFFFYFYLTITKCLFLFFLTEDFYEGHGETKFSKECGRFVPFIFKNKKNNFIQFVAACDKRGSLCGVVVNKLNCNVVVSECEHFQSNTLGKGIKTPNPLRLWVK